MGPVCYGKSYTYRNLITSGMTREEILEWEKENPIEFKRLIKEAVKKFREHNKEKIKKIKKPKNVSIRKKKVKSKKDKNQMTLDSFLESNNNYINKEGYEINVNFFLRPFTLLKKHRTIREVELQKLYEERYNLMQKLSKSNSNGDLDRSFEVMNRIKELEEK